jgi:hypothetical protein
MHICIHIEAFDVSQDHFCGLVVKQAHGFMVFSISIFWSIFDRNAHFDDTCFGSLGLTVRVRAAHG